MFNRVQLIGRVGKIKTTQTKNSKNATFISMATNKRYTNSKGDKKDRVIWHNVHLYDALSELTTKYIKVGDLIFIEGELEFYPSKETNSKGREIQITYISAQKILFLPSGNKKQENYIENNIIDNIEFTL